MQTTVAKYIADFLIARGIDHNFTVTGGGAMFLNDAFGHHPKMICTYHHHEQAAAIAAEGFARVNNRPALVCVTTGPGGTNALTGVLGAWLDSIPMIVISGQVKFSTTIASTDVPLRQLGDQEFNIVDAARTMTKFAKMITEPLEIKRCLEEMIYLATHGRPGPVWLDVPINVQSATIETDQLKGFEPDDELRSIEEPIYDRALTEQILDRIKQSKRPVLNAGNGIRIADAHEIFLRVVDKLNIPVATGWDSIDLIDDEHELYVGRAGIMGDRAGNFAVQNADLVLSIGSRLSLRQVGFNYENWAREAFVIACDIDRNELKKPTLHVELPVWANAKDLLTALDEALPSDEKFADDADWIGQCRRWREKYPVVRSKHFEQTGDVNVYAFIKKLSSKLEESSITVVGNGSACVVGSHAYVIKRGSRFVINSGVAAMGYDLPAAIGACIGSERELVNITGDGSIMMNLQELATISHHRLPIKIFVINNRGYHSIRQTQTNYFTPPLVGVGVDSGDLFFPPLEKIADAFNLPYYRVDDNQKLDDGLEKVLSEKAPLICEVIVDTKQKFEPRAAARKLPNGTMVSATLENLSPFLPREEFLANLFIKPVDEE